MPRHKGEGGSMAAASGLNRVIHEPARLSILSVLRAFETVDFIFLLKQTELSRGNLSSHLSKLESAGYVDIAKEFVDKVPRTLIRLTGHGQDAILAYRDEMNRVLAAL